MIEEYTLLSAVLLPVIEKKKINFFLLFESISRSFYLMSKAYAVRQIITPRKAYLVRFLLVLVSVLEVRP